MKAKNDRTEAETDNGARARGASESDAEAGAAPEGDAAAADEDEGSEADEEGAEGAAGDEDEDEDEGDDDAPPPPPRQPTMLELLRDYYFTFDRRTLGFTRILLGFFLIGDLFRRTGPWLDMFSERGVLPGHVNLWRSHGGGNWSLVNAFSSAGELWVLWAVIFATYCCLLVGFKTKVMQVLSLVFVTSMNGRVLLIENGGYVVHNLLLLWTCFLPLGDRFSVDSLRASLRRSRERTAVELNDRSGLDDATRPDRLITILGPMVLIQIAAIYFFNVLHKTGPAWKNGTAVHYVLYVDRMVTPLIAQIREYAPGWLIIFLTKSTLAFEAAIPVCLFSPLGRAWARRFAVAMMNALHLGFGVVFVLGPFAWALCVFSTLLFGREDWEIAIRTMRRAHRARTVLFDPGSPGAVFVCRLLKRMDRFELLTFEESLAAPHGLAIRAPASPGGGAVVAGAGALADIVAAVPLGPVIAWPLRLPGVRGAVTASMAAMYERGAGRAIGLRVPASGGVAPPPSQLRLTGRAGLSIVYQLIAMVMFVAAVNQAMVELWVVNRRIKVKQHAVLATLSHKLRFLQGWFMFSPNPVMDDGTIVVDALTVDGRRLDPFTGKEPNFNLLDAKSLGYSQIWCDYFNRMHLPANTPYREAMKDYMYRYPDRTGRPEDAIVSGDVYWVKDWNPKWNQTKSYGQDKNKLFSFQNPKAQAQAGAGQPPAGREDREPQAPTPPPPGDQLGPAN